MSEESLQASLELTNEYLRSIELDVNEWAEKYNLTLFTDNPLPNRLRYLLRNIDHQHQQTLESHSLQLKQANEAANKRIHHLDSELFKAGRELSRVKKQYKELLLSVQFWIEACGDGLTHREKNERIRQAIKRAIEVALPADDSF